MVDTTYIQPGYLLVLGLLLGGIWLGAALSARLQRGRSAPAQAKRARPLVAGLKLAGFGALAFVMVVAGLIAYECYRSMLAETAPARREVALPPGLPFEVEEVAFAGSGDVRLAGWYVSPENGTTIILLHGYGGTRADMLWHAETLVAAGYGVLMYDERASGESGGERRSYGWEDGPDVGGAVAFIEGRNGEGAQVGVAGCSMGAQIGLQGAALYPEIGAVWADGPATIRAPDLPRPRNAASALVLAGSYGMDAMYSLYLDVRAPEPLVERIGSIAPRPVMLIAGGTDIGDVTGEEERVRYYAAHAGANARVWVIEEAVHCDGPVVMPQEYARRMVSFFDEAFRDNK